MPKIFLTGSGLSRGYVTGSGNLRNPVRTLLRDADSNKNTYPRVKRIGYYEDSYTLSAFKDDNIIIFGKKIFDDFNLEKNNIEQYEKTPDPTRWIVSNPDIKIRKEDVTNITKTIPSEPHPGALVLAGTTRWIQTVDRVSNPTLKFKVVAPPYEFTDNRAIQLKTTDNTNTLNLQVSTDGSTWEDIAIEEKNISNPAVRIREGGLDPTSPLFRLSNWSYLDENIDRFKRPSYTIKMDASQLKSSIDPTSPIFIRLIQPVVSTPSQSNWAIYNISIISRSQTLIGQTGFELVNSSHLTSSTSSPNYLGNIFRQNSISLPSISDSLIDINEKNPSAIPFNDNLHITNDSKEFYKYGIKESEYPGYSSNLSAKTIIEVDLSTSTPINLGKIDNTQPGGSAARHAITGSGGLDANLMVYWNSTLRRWEKIGWPLGVNDNGANTTSDDIINILTSSAVGFSSVGVIGSGSGNFSSPDDTVTLLPNDLLNAYNRPTDTFGFPFSGRYYATGSQYILAKDLGITKPFLIEKCVIDFNMSGKVNKNTGGVFDGMYFQNNYYNESSATVAVRHSTPTFFILNQKKNSYSNIKIDVYTGSNEQSIISYSESIPAYYQLVSSSNQLTYVDETRELVTYGQHTFVVSSSYPGNNFTPNIKFDDFLRTPIIRDGLTVLNTNTNLQVLDYYFTGSFRTEFKCRNTSKITPFSPYYVVDVPGTAIGAPSSPYGGVYSAYSNIRMGKQLPGRSSGLISDESRALFNGFSAFNPTNKTVSVQYNDVPAAAIGTTFFTNPVVVPKEKGVDLTSPYIVFPEDKLIFGWQTPLNYRRINADDDNSYLTLFGKSKLKLYGSEIREGKEFHEGLSQNLTTNVIHESIGDNPVVDQFQVAARNELTGSVFDDCPFKVDFYNVAILGKLLTVFESDPSLVDLRIQNAWTSTPVNPVNRVDNVPVFSLVNLDTLSVNPTLKTFFLQLNGNLNLSDLSRVFVDSRYKNSNNYFFGSPTNRAEYGSSQNFIGNPDGSNVTKLGGSPKYYFSGKHYGYFSDMIRPGYDGSFVDDPTTSADNIVTEPPIRIQFVKSEYNEASSTRNFIRIRPDEIDGTSELQYQSSNLSLFATSSIGYVEDFVEKNRTYGNFEVVIS